MTRQIKVNKFDLNKHIKMRGNMESSAETEKNQ